MPKVKAATPTKAKAKAKTPAKAPAKAQAAKTAAETNGSGDVEAKRAARLVLEQEQRDYVAKNYVDGDSVLAAVADHLKITSGKTAFLAMQIRVERGEVPKITGKDDDALLKAINVARKQANEHSSWGWLAARSGKPESWIKTGLERLGLYTPKAENISSVRSASNPNKRPVGNTAQNIAKKSGKKRVAGNA